MFDLAITLGDPAGIGPEIVVKALQSGVLAERSCVVVGPMLHLRETAARLGLMIDFPAAKRLDELSATRLACLDIESDGTPVIPGQPSALTGDIAYRSVIEAVRLAMEGKVGAVVTAPLSKAAINRAGQPFIGHTELLAELTGAAESVMMYAHRHLRVAFVTTHVALEQVPALITLERITRVVELTHSALQAFGVGEPRLAVAGLNPHAGEGGLFGRQEIEVIDPAIRELRQRGFTVEGPCAGDTIFVDMLAGRIDGTIAMYHDQGGAAFKALAFDTDPVTGRREVRGVNVTLGLPIIRTSVDHGTAFDIAGRGVASPSSLIDAIRLALQLMDGARRLEAAQSLR